MSLKDHPDIGINVDLAMMSRAGKSTVYQYLAFSNKKGSLDNSPRNQVVVKETKIEDLLARIDDHTD